MSNWKICYPANPIIEGQTTNAFCITSMNVIPHESVKIRVQVIYQNGSMTTEFLIIEQPEYSEWGADDDWVYQKIAHKLALGSLTEGEVATVPYRQTTATNDDTRSVHNEADIQRIQTLQQQLDEQAAKLKTITELLFKNGTL